MDPRLKVYLQALNVMEELFDEVEDIVFFVKDKRRRYVMVNRTLVTRCGLTRKTEVLGKTPLKAFPGPLGREYMKQDEEVIREGSTIKDKLELQVYAEGMPGWCITHKTPIRTEDGTILGMTGFSRDLHIAEHSEETLSEISEVVDYIRTHYDETLRVEGLAEMASMSVYRFKQRIKRIFHLTTGQFIIHTRMNAARDMLKSGYRSIADIAADCGFCDQSAFTRQFKAVTGLTPTQFRALKSKANANDLR